MRVDSFAVFSLIFRFTSFSMAFSLHRVSRNVMCAPSPSSRSPLHQTVLLADGSPSASYVGQLFARARASPCRPPGAPSYHLGVDAFVGTVGPPDAIATSGLDQAMSPPLVRHGSPSVQASEDPAPREGDSCS